MSFKSFFFSFFFFGWHICVFHQSYEVLQHVLRFFILANVKQEEYISMSSLFIYLLIIFTTVVLLLCQVCFCTNPVWLVKTRMQLQSPLHQAQPYSGLYGLPSILHSINNNVLFGIYFILVSYKIL